MAKNFMDEYSKLVQTRSSLDSNIISNKKRKIWEHFRNYKTVDITNLEKRMAIDTTLYKAPLFEIHGSNMLNCSTRDSNDIYVDEKFLSDEENAMIINHQFTHETIHSLCKVSNIKMVFGHIIDNNDNYIIGTNEAVTQIFTDDIEQNELGPQDDYLYFIKNIMRVMKNAFGEELLVNQLLNNDTSFEDEFNKVTNGRFNDFAFVINNIYRLNKQRHYSTITAQEKQELEENQNLILAFTNTLVKKLSINDHNIYERISDDLFNKSFLSCLKMAGSNYNTGTK